MYYDYYGKEVSYKIEQKKGQKRVYWLRPNPHINDQCTDGEIV